MGITRRWEYLPNSSAFAEKWPGLVADAQAIIDATAERGILLTGPAGDGEPTCSTEDGIAFVDGEYDGMKTEVFRIEPPYHGASPGTCFTDGQPYDLAVAAVLSRFGQILPGLWVNSGGEPEDWTEGAALAASLFTPVRRPVPIA